MVSGPDERRGGQLSSPFTRSPSPSIVDLWTSCWACADLTTAQRRHPHRRMRSPTAQSNARPHQRTSSTDLSRLVATTRRLVDAPRRGSRRCKARWEQAGRAVRERDSRCVLVLPASSCWPPSPPSPRSRQLFVTPLRRDGELTWTPRAQNGPAAGADGRLGRCRSWRSTSSGSSRPLYVPLALSARATSSIVHSCACGAAR